MKRSNQPIPAILWDGNKQLSGHLLMADDAIEFLLKDFRRSSLNLRILYNSICGLKYDSIYGVIPQSIIFLQGRDIENVFVVADPPKLKRQVEKKMNAAWQTIVH